MTWLSDCRTAPIAQVARAGNLEVLHAGYLDRCPACGETQRGAHDARVGAARINAGTGLWCCYRCEVGGSVVELATACLFGIAKVPSGDPRWREVRLWFASYGWCEAPKGEVPKPRERPSAPAPAAARGYPPVGEVREVWEQALRWDDLRGRVPARDYVERFRGIEANALGGLDLLRVLPSSTPWRPWFGRAADHELRLRLYPLVVPLYDALGELRSVRFRIVDRVAEPDDTGLRLRWRRCAPHAAPKARNPTGHDASGLILAEPMARAVLSGRYADEGVTWNGELVVVEGEPDFLTWAVHRARGREIRETGTTFAVIGIASGGWSDAVAARIPDRATVTVRTHFDAPGQAYASRVAASLDHRCTVLRPPAPERRHVEG